MSDIVYIRQKYKEITGNANADDVPIYAMKQVVKAYEKGRADEIVKFILTLQEIYDYVWDRDIPSPTCPEYKEHHDDCIEIMAKIKDKIYQLKEQN